MQARPSSAPVLRVARTLVAFLAIPLATAGAAQGDPIVEILAAAQADSETAKLDAKKNAADAKQEQPLAEHHDETQLDPAPAEKVDTDEAREKADIAMAAAQASMTLGMIQGVLQIGAAAVSFTAGDCGTGEGSLIAHATVANTSAALARTLAQDEVLRLQKVMKELPPSSTEKKQLRKKIAKARRSALLHKKAAKKVEILAEHVVTLCS